MKITPMQNIKYIVVHCSATRATQDIGAAEITAMHRKRGWRTIGYHHVVRRNGKVETGRPESEPGAHTLGHNGHSIAVVMVGGVKADGVSAETNFTEAQYVGLRALLTILKGKYPSAWIVGHRDLSPDRNGNGRVEKGEWVKACPTFDVTAWWLGDTMPDVYPS
ncbi:MAG: N-acetylmuramoyl-L-alanine amidase [Armatimonadaceae bacterium]